MFQTKTSDLIIDVIGFNIVAENINSYLNADSRLFINYYTTKKKKTSLEPYKKAGRMPYRN